MESPESGVWGYGRMGSLENGVLGHLRMGLGSLKNGVWGHRKIAIEVTGEWGLGSTENGVL
jgi:hypothetical protein